MTSQLDFLQSVDVYAAGAVVWRERAAQLEVLLVYRPQWQDWSFPKGKLKAGETLRECCLREVQEEIGKPVILGQALGWNKFIVGKNKFKAVHFWAAQIVANDYPALIPRRKAKLASETEIADRRWVGAEEAFTLLSYRRDQEILEDLVAKYRRNSLQTIPIIFLRHAKAVKRENWDEIAGEELRPLSKSGQIKAEELIMDLSAYGVLKVKSSPWKRCKDTLKSYARIATLKVCKISALTEAAYREDPIRFQEVIEYLLWHSTQPTVVCLHRPTLGAVMEVLRKYVVNLEEPKLPTENPWLRTGEMVIAHVSHPKYGVPKIVQVELLEKAGML